MTKIELDIHNPETPPPIGLKMRLKLSSRFASHAWKAIANVPERLLAKRDSTGFRRIYHYHIRKTGGTSIVKMFLVSRR